MNSIEDRLRDAYRGAAGTVGPDSIRPLGEPVSARPQRGQPWHRPAGRRLLVPLAAAMAIALVAVLVAIVVPRLLSGDRLAAGSGPATGSGPAGRYVVAVIGPRGGSPDGRVLSVRSAATGASTGTVRAPGPGLFFSDVVTGDGRTYVAAMVRPHHCATWLYQFRLSGSGRPGPLIRYAVPSVGEELGLIAVSRDASTFAFDGQRCDRTGGRLVQIRVASGPRRLVQWTLPGRTAIGSLSLTADGSALGFSASLVRLRASAAYVLPATAAPGPALRRGQRIAVAARFGRDDEISSSVIAADGRTVYFTTRPAGAAASGSWQLRAADVRTGRLRLIGTYAGRPVFLTANPQVNRILTTVVTGAAPSPSKLPSPLPAAPTATASPTPYATAPTATASPTPSATPSTATASPTPSATAPTTAASPTPSRPSPAPTTPRPAASPVPSPGSGTAGQPQYRVEEFRLNSGAMTVLHWQAWPDRRPIPYAW